MTPSVRAFRTYRAILATHPRLRIRAARWLNRELKNMRRAKRQSR